MKKIERLDQLNNIIFLCLVVPALPYLSTSLVKPQQNQCTTSYYVLVKPQQNQFLHMHI